VVLLTLLMSSGTPAIEQVQSDLHGEVPGDRRGASPAADSFAYVDSKM